MTSHNPITMGEGCLFDSHLGQYIYQEIVKLAEGIGYEVSDNYNPPADGTMDEGEMVIWESERAEDWLNANIAELDHYFGWYDGDYFYHDASWWEDGYRLRPAVRGV